MPSANRVLEVYLELAELYEQRGQAQLRDRFLVLASDAALSAGRADEAERLRLRLLQLNPHHMLKPYASLQEALKVPDVQDYIAKLRLSYSPDTAEQQLQTLRASGDVVGQQEPPPRPAPPKPRPPEPRPPEPRTPEPPSRESQESKDSPDVQLFYPMADDAQDIPMTMPPRKRSTIEPAPKPKAPLPPPVVPPPPLRTSASDIPPTLQGPPRKQGRSPALSPFAMEPPAPVPSRPVPSEKEEQELATGYWVSTGLFVLLLVAGLALAGYTFVRPFLPAEWFR